MLELNDGEKLIDQLWTAATERVELSDEEREKFFGVKGAGPVFHDNKRTYHRYYMRSRAILKRGETLIGAYTKDVSRQGVGFISPVPLKPKERVKLRVPAAELSLEIARCRRVDKGCFECGGRFAL
jgi:PilZ domain